MSTLMSVIYPGVAELAVSINGALVPVRGVGLVQKLPNSVQTAMLPVRILMPPDDGDEGASTSKFIRFGAVLTCEITWRINDLLLYAPIARGTGAGEHIEVLETYRVSYISAVAAIAGRLSNSAVISEVSTRVTGYRYANVDFVGVMCALTVEELA